MRTRNIRWKLALLVFIPIAVAVLCGIALQANDTQGDTGRISQVRPQVREAALGFLGPIGLVHGQTLRIGLLGKGTPGGGDVNSVLIVTAFDCQGGTLATVNLNPGANQCSFFDLNADQIPQSDFDGTGRAEVSVGLRSGGGIWNPGSFFASAQVFDNLTGKSTLAIDFCK